METTPIQHGVAGNDEPSYLDFYDKEVVSPVLTVVKNDNAVTPSQNIKNTKIPLSNRVYMPSWENEPKEQEAVITLNGINILTQGNSIALVSLPGVGKTNMCFSILSAIINPHCDSLGLAVKLPAGKDKVLCLDSEQTHRDTWRAWYKAMQRAGIKKSNIDERIIVANIKALSTNERIEFLTSWLIEHPDTGLVIIDGAGDFVIDTNSITEANNFIHFLNRHPETTFAVTIHPNPDSENKPRGHLGSEICRKAECTLLLEKVKGENNIFRITSEFEHGKVRSDGNVTTYYAFSEQHGMFISAEYKVTPKEDKKKKEYAELTEQIFNGITQLAYSGLLEKIMKIKDVGKEAAKSTFNRWLLGKTIRKTDINCYEKI